MPYSISQQRIRLELRLNDIKRKLRSADKKKVPTDLRDFSIAAAIFLAHAEFENYFVEALDGVAKAYSQGLTTSGSLPPKLRAHLVCEKFGLDHVASKIISKAGEQDLFVAVERWFSSPNITLISGAAPLQQIFGKDIYGDYTYPSIKNIEKVLRRMGVGDPRGALNRELKRDAIGLLETIASLRTALAHSATLPGVSIGDVAKRIDGLKLFSRAFDRMLYAHTRSTISDAIWISSMT